LIFTYKGKNLLKKTDIRTESDTRTHVYTLVLNPDNTYEVLIDGSEAAKGKLEDDWDFLPPKMIKDPAVSKPSDWVDEQTIADPEDTKPAGWDDIPAQVPDPTATKPEDWDDEMDGSWEAPMVPNPEYKGEWRAKQIPNPAYKGEWVHPEIANPEYAYDPNLYLYSDIGVVGFELWQVKAGTIFDNILVTDDRAEADSLAQVSKKLQEAEKRLEEEEAQKAREEAEKKRAEEEAAQPTETPETPEGKDEL